MKRPSLLPWMVVALLIIGPAYGLFLRSQYLEQRTQQAKDTALALAYKDRKDTIARCQATNVATLARIATAEAIVALGAKANPALPHDPATQLLLAAYVKKVNTEIEKLNKLQRCTWPALGLPKLPPLTTGAREIIRRLPATSTTSRLTPTTIARAPPTQPGKSGAHRKHPKG